MRKGTSQPIGDVLKNVVEKLSQKKDSDILKIFSAWPAACGQELAGHTRPVSLKRGMLLVNADESAWLYQANLKQERLLKALKKKIGQNKIQKIQFRIGNLK